MDMNLCQCAMAGAKNVVCMEQVLRKMRELLLSLDEHFEEYGWTSSSTGP